MPFTSFAASSDAYRFANPTASSITTSYGTSPRSSSRIATRSALRSTTPSRSAVQSSDAAVMRSSSSAARATVSSASSRAHGSISPPYGAPISPLEQIPLVDEEERLPARLAARDHASSPTWTSTRRLDPAHRAERAARPPPGRARRARRSARRGGPQPTAARRRASRSIVRRRRTRMPVDPLRRAHRDPDEHAVRNRDRAVLGASARGSRGQAPSSASVEVE